MKLLLTTIFLSLFAISCGGFLYHPTPYWYSDPKANQLDYSEVRITNSDGFSLYGMFFSAPKEKKVLAKKRALILFFHGNAQNVTSHYLNFAWLPATGHDFLLFDYRGYGISEGQPYQRGLQTDAEAMLDYALDLFKKGDYQQFIVYGQSLGGAVALTALEHYKNKDKVNLLVIDSSFLSYSAIAFDKLKGPWLTYLLSPLAYLLITDETAPWLALPKLTTPTLVIHGDHDFHIPYKFGQELFAKLPLAPDKKWFWTVASGEHIDIFFRDNGRYQQQFLEFIASSLY